MKEEIIIEVHEIEPGELGLTYEVVITTFPNVLKACVGIQMKVEKFYYKEKTEHWFDEFGKGVPHKKQNYLKQCLNHHRIKKDLAGTKEEEKTA